LFFSHFFFFFLKKKKRKERNLLDFYKTFFLKKKEMTDDSIYTSVLTSFDTTFELDDRALLYANAWKHHTGLWRQFIQQKCTRQRWWSSSYNVIISQFFPLPKGKVVAYFPHETIFFIGKVHSGLKRTSRVTVLYAFSDLYHVNDVVKVDNTKIGCLRNDTLACINDLVAKKELKELCAREAARAKELCDIEAARAKELYIRAYETQLFQA